MSRSVLVGMAMLLVIVALAIVQTRDIEGFSADKSAPLSSKADIKTRQNSLNHKEKDSKAITLPKFKANHADSAPGESLIPTDLWQAALSPDQLPDEYLGSYKGSYQGSYQGKNFDSMPLLINQDLLSSLTLGDEITVPIPQLRQSYPMLIKTLETHSNGDQTINGALKETKGPYGLTITKGGDFTFASITTPEGSFEMEALANFGWITSAASLDSLIDIKLNDYQLPNIQR